MLERESTLSYSPEIWYQFCPVNCFLETDVVTASFDEAVYEMLKISNWVGDKCCKEAIILQIIDQEMWFIKHRIRRSHWMLKEKTNDYTSISPKLIPLTIIVCKRTSFFSFHFSLWMLNIFKWYMSCFFLFKSCHQVCLGALGLAFHKLGFVSWRIIVDIITRTT